MSDSEAITEKAGMSEKDVDLEACAENKQELEIKADPATAKTDGAGIIEVPDGGYGWVVVIAVALVNVSTWASNSAYSIYLAHYLKYNTFPGGSKIDYAAVGGIAFGVGLFLSPIVQLIFRRFGVRITIAIGAIFQFVGMMLAAFSTKLWELFLTQGLLISIGLAFCCLPANSILPQWFRKRRALAMSIASCGSGVGGVMFNLAIERIVQVKSVKWAIITQGIICVVCLIVAIILCRTREHAVKSVIKLWDTKLFFYAPFACAVLWIAFTLLGYVVLLYNLTDFTLSLGYTSSQGAIVSCMISVGATFGRPTAGYLSDKFGVILVSGILNLIVAVFCLAMWIPSRNLAEAIVFALIQGAMMGTVWATLPAVVTRVSGLRQMATAMSMCWVIVGISGIVSPIIGIKLRSTPPDGAQYSPTQYRNPAIYCGIMYFMSSVMMFLLRGYIIARDDLAHKSGSHIDNDETKIQVKSTDWMKHCLSKATVRKV